MTPVIDNEWPPHECERVNACPVCNSTERRSLHDHLRDHMFSTQGSWDLQSCSNCSSAYLDPRPSPQSIGRAYANYYTHANTEVAGFLKQVSRRARNGYINRHWNTALTPASTALGALVGAVQSLRAKVDHELMRSFTRSQKQEKLLDVGCGSGQFLFLMKQAGWQVKGIDFDHKAVTAAQTLGLDVALGGLDILADQSDTYDAITLSHVIEHVFDPAETLTQCFRLLRSGGTLWIETPNLDSIGHRLFGRHWRGLEPPRHLVLFNWSSLESLLERAGFVEIAPAPWRPQLKPLALASQKIAALEGVDTLITTKQLPHINIRLAEAEARKAPATREYITFVAVKPSTL